MFIANVCTALPPNRYHQEQLFTALQQRWSGSHHNSARLEQLHRAVSVGSRNLALPIERYYDLDFTKANSAFIEVGTDLGAEAVEAALTGIGLMPDEVDAIYFASVTGISAPSIDAKLANRLKFRSDIKRTPIFGLGCVAGAAGLARVNDYLRGHPQDVVVLLCVELCSLTLQTADTSIPNLIASGLFGDGAAAVVAVGADHRLAKSKNAGPRVLATKSRFYPDTEKVMGWEIGSSGFQIVLSSAVPKMVQQHAKDDLDAFLGALGVNQEQLSSFVIHTGGPKVLEAFEESLGLTDGELALSWRSLNEVGNLSSASVLFVLEETLRTARPQSGDLGLLMAMGPGFCAELVLLEW